MTSDVAAPAILVMASANLRATGGVVDIDEDPEGFLRFRTQDVMPLLS